MSLVWVQLGAVAATVMASVLTYLNARRADRSQADVAHRTTSLTEFEKALAFTGTQLDELRAAWQEQHDEIVDLRDLYERCEADKRLLRRELADLRGRL